MQCEDVNVYRRRTTAHKKSVLCPQIWWSVFSYQSPTQIPIITSAEIFTPKKMHARACVCVHKRRATSSHKNRSQTRFRKSRLSFQYKNSVPPFSISSKVIVTSFKSSLYPCLSKNWKVPSLGRRARPPSWRENTTRVHSHTQRHRERRRERERRTQKQTHAYKHMWTCEQTHYTYAHARTQAPVLCVFYSRQKTAQLRSHVWVSARRF